jgi:luciferase family oxidoreductase group 1
MAAIAATTPAIRIGSAGVMLPHYSALKVAEQFRVLEAIAPGRSILGVGRAPGSDRLTAQALNPYANAADDFPRQVYELQCWVAGDALGRRTTRSAASPRSRRARPVPRSGFSAAPTTGARLAAHFGLPYAFAYFFSDGRAWTRRSCSIGETIDPARRYPAPIATICVWALAGRHQAEARHLSTTREFWRVGFEQGHRRRWSRPRRRRRILITGTGTGRASTSCGAKPSSGTAGQVAASLTALAQRLELTELVVNTWTYDPCGATSLVRAAGGGVAGSAGKLRPCAAPTSWFAPSSVRACGTSSRSRATTSCPVFDAGARRRARSPAYAARGGRSAHGGRVGAHHGEAGIALVTGGPGHANALSALYTAQMAESPVILLSGHAAHDEQGHGSFQEMRQAEMAAPVTKASWTCAGAADVAAGRRAGRAHRAIRGGRARCT